MRIASPGRGDRRWYNGLNAVLTKEIEHDD
jgi:hypothetical protein